MHWRRRKYPPRGLPKCGDRVTRYWGGGGKEAMLMSCRAMHEAEAAVTARGDSPASLRATTSSGSGTAHAAGGFGAENRIKYEPRSSEIAMTPEILKVLHGLAAGTPRKHLCNMAAQESWIRYVKAAEGPRFGGSSSPSLGYAAFCGRPAAAGGRAEKSSVFRIERYEEPYPSRGVEGNWGRFVLF